MKCKSLFTVLIILGLILAACQDTDQPAVESEPVEELTTTVPELAEQPTAETEAVEEPTAEQAEDPVEQPATEPPAEEPTAEPESAEPPTEPTDRPVVESPTPDEAGVLPLEHFTIDATGMAATWGHTIDEGTALDLNYPPGNNGIPPHIVVSFAGPNEQAGHPGPFSLNVAQGRIMPVEAYLDMYEEAGNDAVQTRVDALTAILEERPDSIDGAVPVLPIIGASQVVQGKTTYVDFNGGSGVGFVAAYAQGVGPFFDDSLSYLFQGLTDDGEHWVSFVWPLTVNFLPKIEEASQEYQEKAYNDHTAYLAEVNQMVDEAADSDYDPVLVALNQMMESMIIGEAAQGEIPPSPNIFGLRWQWQQVQDAAGIDDIAIPNPESYEIVFWNDGTYLFRADCNVGYGSYTMNGNSLSLEFGPITLSHCSPESLDNDYLLLLNNVEAYATSEGKLGLNLPEEAGKMIFANAGPVPYAALAEIGRAEGE